ncbi:hypothetical protein [Cohnella thailandensis]|uniref:GNAT family N-acetyltransferase n=1 Tax=Cohnella thailandensis TaxID=557557 RepID=A0A841SYC2_9BACL|nr:hypothetical protein [Cohnella thailandensis]MBB6634840.1 hypothetical protein [Cohnella thailandensis]MBP1975939.1 hypothetical protein [Cohnella thailandensis]
MIVWSIASTEEEQADGAMFLCRNAERLGTPFKWSTVIHLLIYTLEDNGLLIGKDESGAVVSAVAYTAGAEDDRYKDRARIQVHLLYIEDRWRGGAVLLAGYRALLKHLRQSQAGWREIVFYAGPTEENRRRFRKRAELLKTVQRPSGEMDFYLFVPLR